MRSWPQLDNIDEKIQAEDQNLTGSSADTRMIIAFLLGIFLGILLSLAAAYSERKAATTQRVPVEPARWHRSCLAETVASDHASAACYRGRSLVRAYEGNSFGTLYEMQRAMPYARDALAKAEGRLPEVQNG